MALKYKTEHIGGEAILRIDYSEIPRIPSIEEDPFCMAETIEILSKNPNISRIVFYQQKEYEYDYEQTTILKEIAVLYKDFSLRESIINYTNFVKEGIPSSVSNTYYSRIKHILSTTLKQDPFGAYLDLLRLKRREEVLYQKEIYPKLREYREYIIELLKGIISLLEKTRLINLIKDFETIYHHDHREVYRRVFYPMIKPDFIFTKLMASYPRGGDEIDRYKLKDSEVVIFKLPNTIQLFYHITPPEFMLDEDKYELLHMAREVMAEHKPRKEEFMNPEHMREVFYNVGHDLLEELAGYKGIKLSTKDLNLLSEILLRYTVGFGLLEVLLRDEKVQDTDVSILTQYKALFISERTGGNTRKKGKFQSLLNTRHCSSVT